MIDYGLGRGICASERYLSMTLLDTDHAGVAYTLDVYYQAQRSVLRKPPVMHGLGGVCQGPLTYAATTVMDLPINHGSVDFIWKTLCLEFEHLAAVGSPDLNVVASRHRALKCVATHRVVFLVVFAPSDSYVLGGDSC